MDIKIVNKYREVHCTVLNNPTSTKVLIIAPAMGVARSFYKDIADYFFKLSYSVIFFDYYGMLRHKQVPRDYKIRLSDWGRKDINSVITFAQRQFPEEELYFLGHSIAGQILPLAENSHKIKAAYLVASQNVSNKNWDGAFKLKVNIFWYFFIPFFITIFGYVPAFVYGGKYDIHKSIAKDWAKWGRNKSGILGVEVDAPIKYKDINLPLKFLSFSDDKMLAPLKSVKHLYHSYGSPYKFHEHLHPKRFGLDSIGHFNFFKPKCEFLWPKIDSWFTLISNHKTIKAPQFSLRKKLIHWAINKTDNVVFSHL
ncbi:MAG TPA: hypothetical protein VKN14_01435 [Flavobacteriaceae bacterium]|nr:hypothetical protein [Flavobacteriaceae bacterium]